MEHRNMLVQCQQCRAAIEITQIDPNLTESNISLPSGLEESFMILEESMARDRAAQGPSTQGVEESFVMLPKGTERAGTSSSASYDELSSRRVPLEDQITSLTKIFELATHKTALDQPLCPACASEVERELRDQLEEVQQEIAAYETLAAQLEQQALDDDKRLQSNKTGNSGGPSKDLDIEARLYRELKRAQDEERTERAKLEAAERQLAAAEVELAAVNQADSYLDAAEERYWQAANSLALNTRTQLEERDELSARVAAAERNIATLQRTNVFADVFKISYDGPFGTISGLRLGRTPEQPVQWEEINAAWGQAVMLLDSLARALNIKFKGYRLDPKGSFSSIVDGNGGVYELWGPVNKILCTSYDRAQVAFLACLKQFAEELAAKGAMENGAPFALKYPIDGDRVRGQSVRFALSRDKAWTKALKYMLVNLKYCLLGALYLMHRPRGDLPALPREGPIRR